MTDNISVRTKIAQCVFPRISADDYFSSPKAKEFYSNLVEWGVGGFCVFHGKIDDTAKMISELQSLTKIPLLFCADFEFGLPMRLDDGTAFPQSLALAIADDTSDTKRIARAIAVEAKHLGIHWNLAPVCDINSNENNPIINIRSYGKDAITVITHSTAFFQATQQEKVLACTKHFPGHGDCDFDSHLLLPVLNHSLEKLQTEDLVPFYNAVKLGVKSIMTGHLAVTALDKSNLPASLSNKITTELLRKRMNFPGLIVTDALDMKAISDTYSGGEAAALALKAGANIALMPTQPFEAIEEIEKQALINSDLLEHINNSFNMITAEKQWCGLFRNRFPQADKLKHQYIENERIALDVAYKAIRLEGDETLLPLIEHRQFAGFAVPHNNDLEQGAMFFRILAQATENDCDFGFVDENISDEEIEDLKNNLGKPEVYIFVFFSKPKAYGGGVGISEKYAEIIEKLSAGKKKIIVLIGNPYIKNSLNADLFITTYSATLPSIAASILKLIGKKPSI